MAGDTDTLECEDITPHPKSEKSWGVIVSFSDSTSGSVCRLTSRSSNYLARSNNPDRLYISMSERMEHRKQRRQELEMRYECARKQQEEEKRMKEELKLTSDILRRRAMAEQNRAILRKQKQLGREVQRRRELLRRQQDLASLHNFRRILLHYGLMPWCRFLLQCRKILKTAAMYYDCLLMKRTLKCLYTRRVEGKSSPKLRARTLALRARDFQARSRLRKFWLCWIDGRRDHHRKFLLKRSCMALKEILEYRKELDHIGYERNQGRLLSESWLKWTDYISKEKCSQLLKCLELEQIASLHWQRVNYVRFLSAWKDGIGFVRHEQKRTQHKAEAWTKIHFWLGE